MRLSLPWRCNQLPLRSAGPGPRADPIPLIWPLQAGIGCSWTSAGCSCWVRREDDRGDLFKRCTRRDAALESSRGDGALLGARHGGALFFTCGWCRLHFATNTVREIYPASALVTA